jgi:Putative bacterial sensory transduction regulator
MADKPPIMPLPAPLPPEQAAAMRNKVNSPLSQGLITRALDGLRLPYTLDSDGDILTGFSEDQFGGDLSIWLLVGGDNKDILRILVTVNRKIPQSKWHPALVMCNEYHQNSRYGRAYLVFQQPDDPEPEPTLCFDSRIPLRDGATEDFLKTFIVANLGDARQLFAMAHREKGLY